MTKKLAIYVLIVIVGLTGFFLYQTSKLTFDYEMEKFFPKDDEITSFYNQYRERFTSDNDFLLIGIEAEQTIYQTGFVKASKSFTEKISKLNYVDNVFSIYNLPGGFYADEKLDSTRVTTYPQLTSNFVENNAKSISILVLHKPFLSKKGCDELVENVNKIISEYQFKNVHLAGRSVAQKHYIETSQKELAIFFSIGVMLLIVVLFFTFRTVWGIVIPLLVVVLSIVWTVGLMTLFGEPFNLLLTILPTIIFVVGISDVIHIVSRFLDLIRENHSKKDAIKQAFKEVGLATFFTSITTAFGFLTLLLSNIEPIQSFGLYTALGVLVAYVLAFSFLPSVLILTKTPSNKAFNFGGEFWKKTLSNLLRFILLRRKAIVISTLVFTAISLVGIYQLKVENLVLEDIKEDNKLKQSFNFFDEHYSGVRPFEMQIEVVNPEQNVFDNEVLLELEKLHYFLETDYGVKGLMSPLSLVKGASFLSSFDTDQGFAIPKSKRKLKQIENQIKSNPSQGLFADNFTKSRLSGRVKDLGSAHYREKNKELETFISTSISPKILKLTLTGSAELIDQNNLTLSSSLLQGLVLAFLVVVIIVGLIFKSAKMVVLALIPNILPLLFIGGLMGFLGIDIKVSTSIIFTIAFGIAVDDTLHFINKLKIELNKEKPLALAVRNAFISSGKAIIITSVILFTGFISLVGSSFLGTFYVGLLVSLTLLFAVVVDLFLLPLLILKFYRN